MIKPTLFICLSILIALTGCGRTESTKTETPAGTETAATKPADAPGSTSITGVASCDEYLSKVEMCLKKPNVPEAAKAAYRQSLEQNRSAWKQAASTEQGRTSLESSCRMAIQSAKTFFDSCQ
jgi:hypothetical protein